MCQIKFHPFISHHQQRVIVNCCVYLFSFKDFIFSLWDQETKRSIWGQARCQNCCDVWHCLYLILPFESKFERTETKHPLQFLFIEYNIVTGPSKLACWSKPLCFLNQSALANSLFYYWHFLIRYLSYKNCKTTC